MVSLLDAVLVDTPTPVMEGEVATQLWNFINSIGIFAVLGAVTLFLARKFIWRIVAGSSESIGLRLRFYVERHKRSDRVIHMIGVPLAQKLWEWVFRFFAGDPIDEAQNMVERQGFEWLTEETFGDEPDPEYCWRRAFEFSEIREGYAIDRTAEDDEHDTVTEQLMSGLENGENQVLVGSPGAGKTTIIKMVASTWYDEVGPVIYREGEESRPIADLDELKDGLSIASRIGPVLVVVEDAARHDSLPMFEFMDDFWSDEKMQFLLDSRQREWEKIDERVAFQPDVSNDTIAEIRGKISRCPVPVLDDAEIKRVFDKFEEVTEIPVREDHEGLAERLRTEHGASPMLLLTYHLPVGNVETSPAADDEDSALLRNIKNAFNYVKYPDWDRFQHISKEDWQLVQDVVLLINVVNAADVGIYREFLHTVASNEREHHKVDEIISYLDGRYHFGVDEGTRLYSNHELWSQLYLVQFLEAESNSPQSARSRFERCVNSLFSICRENERRRLEEEWFGKTDKIADVEANPTLEADRLALKVFEIGVELPKLSELYDSTDSSNISIPDACSELTVADCALRRSWMFRVLGDLQVGQTELDQYRKLAENIQGRTEKIKATYFSNKGTIAYERGDLNAAEEYCLRSLELQSNIGDKSGQARSLNHLGVVAESQGDLNTAEEFYRQSLDLALELDDKRGHADSLNNLGNVRLNRGDFDTAKELYQQSLDLKREFGDRSGQAKSLGNLGLIAENREKWANAIEYLQQCVTILREFGAVRDEVKAYRNLARNYDNLDNVDDVVETCNKALEVIENSDLDFGDERREFVAHLSRHGEFDGTGTDLYTQGLLAIRNGEPKNAIDLLRGSWRRRESLSSDDDEFRPVLAAGVAYAAYIRLFEGQFELPDESSVLDEIEPHSDRLSPAESALFEYLSTGSTDTTPEELRESVDRDDEELGLADLEAVAFARLLKELSNDQNGT